MSDLTRFRPDDDLKPLIAAVAAGSDPDLESQLIKKSRQEPILKYTPKDAAERFADQSALDRWRAGGREIHWLLGPDDDLAGVIWYGKKPFPLELDLPEIPTETFAIRLYDGYAGHHLAVPFMRQSLALHAQAQRDRGQPIAGIWLETDNDNPAALKVYGRFGYQEVKRDDKRVTMVLPASVIAALPRP